MSKPARLPGHRFDDGFEGRRVMQGQIGQYLAVESGVFLVETVDQPRISGAIHPGTGIDPGNPQATEGSFLVLAVAVGITPGLFYRVLGYGVHFAACTEVALGGIHDLFAARPAGDCVYGTWHMVNLAVCRDPFRKGFFDRVT